MRSCGRLFVLLVAGCVCVQLSGRQAPFFLRDTVPDELPLPAVPVTLCTPAARAGYIVRHFWDALDFADTLHSHNRAFMEQAFANYLSLFPIADTAVLAPAVDSLVTRAATDEGSLSLLREISEKYLYEQDSPMYDEEHYLLFAEAFLSAPVHGSERLRLHAQREAMLKNRIGTRAADFTFETLAGRRMRLSDFARERKTLLLFYDPDCAHCMEVIAELSASETLRAAVGHSEIAVLAVYAGAGGGSDRALWRREANRIPSAWTVGYDDGTIYARDLYVLRNLPALYLLDAGGNVMIKNATVARLAGLSSSSR